MKTANWYLNSFFWLLLIWLYINWSIFVSKTALIGQYERLLKYMIFDVIYGISRDLLTFNYSSTLSFFESRWIFLSLLNHSVLFLYWLFKIFFFHMFFFIYIWKESNIILEFRLVWSALICHFSIIVEKFWKWIFLIFILILIIKK